MSLITDLTDPCGAIQMFGNKILYNNNKNKDIERERDYYHLFR